MEFEDFIETIKTNIRKGSFTSEAAVSQGVILPILSNLGWPVFKTSIVIPQYSLEGRRVDYALCHPEDRPAAFVEVKKIGSCNTADRQLFEYAFVAGVPLAILTDGQEWSFYLPGEQGRFDERRVYKIDLLERTSEEASERLIRYLKYERVCSGEALNSARNDYRNVARNREIKATLPKAWVTLIKEQDSILLDLLSEKVEDLCGYKPDIDTCAQFLEDYNKPIEQELPHGRIRITTQRSPSETTTGRSNNLGAGRFNFKYNNSTYPARSARDVMVKVFQILADEDKGFLERFTARSHGRTRRYISKNKSELYKNRPDLVDHHSIEFIPGWWIGTNYSRQNIQDIIDLAFEVAGPRISSKFQVKVN